MLWDMKLSPAKEKAVAKELELLGDIEGLDVVVKLEKLVEDALLGACLLSTETWRLLASAFSCCRMKLAKLWIQDGH